VSLDFRVLTESDLDAMLDVRIRAFGPMPAGGADRWYAVNRDLMGEGRNFGVFADGVMAACGKARGFDQAWHGRVVAMAGMAGITVLPEFRGRGIGSRLMRGLSEVSVDRGEPISALYPATVTLYRHLGWELVGAQSRYALPAAQLRTLGGTATVRGVTADDIEGLQALCADAVSRDVASGPLLRSAATWRQLIEDRDTFVYRTDDGVVVYGWDGEDLSVDFLWAASEDSARSLWSVVGSGSSVAKTVRAYLSPDDPVFWLLPEEAGHDVGQHSWMLRVLDVGGALAARGFPAGLSAELALAVEDRESAANTGTWRLEVADGKGAAERVEPGADVIRLSACGLAGLYAGRPVSALRRAGLAQGGAVEDDAALDAVFATPRPYLTDYF
jgi:predicted acetyltransferase